MASTDYDRIPEQDRAKLVLLRCARSYPERLRQASLRIQARVAGRLGVHQEQKRAQAARDVELLDVAYARVAHGTKVPRGRSSDDRERLTGFIRAFREQGRREGSIADDGGVEAYVRFCVHAHRRTNEDALRTAYGRVTGREAPGDRGERSSRPVHPNLLSHYMKALAKYQEEHGDLGTTEPKVALTSALGDPPWDSDEEVAVERRAALDPERVVVHATGLAFRFAMEMRELMAEEPDRIRTLEEWWDVLFLVLCVEYPDMPPSELGLDEADLPWGRWEEVGGDMFSHRDGMRSYLDRTGDDPRRQHNNEMFWLLARRAAVHLEAEGGVDGRVRPVHADCMEAVRDLDALAEDTRVNAEAIAGKVGGPQPESLKEPLADLAKWGYLGSKTGRRGGSWLTGLGVREIDWRRPKKQ